MADKKPSGGASETVTKNAGLTPNQLEAAKAEARLAADIRSKEIAAKAELDKIAAETAREEARAKIEAQKRAADAAERDAEARREADKAARDPAVLAKKQAVELEKQARETAAMNQEAAIRVGVQVGAVITGLAGGHAAAHWVEARNTATMLKNASSLEALAAETKVTLARYDGVTEKAKAVTAPKEPAAKPGMKPVTPTQRKALQKIVDTSKDPVAIKKATDQLVKANTVAAAPKATPATPAVKAKLDPAVTSRLKAGTAADKRKLSAAVRAFDKAKLGSYKGPLGIAMGALFVGDALWSRHNAHAVLEEGKHNAAEARAAAKEARAAGNTSLAEAFDAKANAHEANAKASHMAWDTFGVANYFAGGALLATRAVHKDTPAAVLHASNVATMEAARDAAGMTTKTAGGVIKDRAVKALEKGGVGALAKGVGLSTLAKFIPVVGGAIALGAAYSSLRDLGKAAVDTAKTAGLTGDPQKRNVADAGGVRPAGQPYMRVGHNWQGQTVVQTVKARSVG